MEKEKEKAEYVNIFLVVVVAAVFAAAAVISSDYYRRRSWQALWLAALPSSWPVPAGWAAGGPAVDC